MKNYKFFAVIIGLLFLFNSCDKDNEDETIEIVSTKVVGIVSDVTRQIIHNNFKVTVRRYTYGCSSGFGGGCGVTDVNEVASTFTDSQGNYEIDFDYFLDTKYSYQLDTDFVGVGDGPFVDYVNENARITSGITNTIDLDFWYASILKLDLNVSNNFYPPLRVSNKIVSGGFYFFSGDEIYASQTNTTVYIPTKPNSEVRLLFGYATGPSNDEYHPKYEYITTGIQDTIPLSFEIDCASF